MASESRIRKFAPIAQRIEQKFSKLQVAGSIPAGRTKKCVACGEEKDVQVFATKKSKRCMTCIRKSNV